MNENRMSVLEKQLRQKALTAHDGYAACIEDDADLVHKRDTKLWGLMDAAQKSERMYLDSGMTQHAQICRVLANNLRILLEGETE